MRDFNALCSLAGVYRGVGQCHQRICKQGYTMDIQVNLDMTDSMGPGKLVRHMQNLSYTYDSYLICIQLGPSISSIIVKGLSYSGPPYPSSPVPTISLYEKI